MSNTTVRHAAAPAPLLPVQQEALEALQRTIAAHRVAMLMGQGGAGKTTILRALHARLGGAFLTSRDFIEESGNGRHPLALDETIYYVLREALRANDVVIVDDFQLVSMVTCCTHAYPRQNFLAAALVPLAAIAQDEGKTLVFCAGGMPLAGLSETVPATFIKQFTAADYGALAAAYLGARNAKRIDEKKVHRFAPNLNARQLRNTCEALRDDPSLDTEAFVAYLREHHMASNVDLGEVQAVDLNDLKGLDDVLEALEANVILPLENSAVAEELNLKPKRGVLLAGPPGTARRRSVARWPID